MYRYRMVVSPIADCSLHAHDELMMMMVVVVVLRPSNALSACGLQRPTWTSKVSLINAVRCAGRIKEHLNQLPSYDNE